MEDIDTQEKPQLRVDLETYLSKLPEADRNNLKSLADNFQKLMKEQKKSGSLIIVGGSIDKPWPRKDIDILLLCDQPPQDLQRGDLTEYRRALADFGVFRNMIKHLIANINHLEIDENHIIKPLIDEEFNSESILRHDGAVLVKSSSQEGIPLEFIRMSQRGSYRDGLIQKDLPFVVLAETTSKHKDLLAF